MNDDDFGIEVSIRGTVAGGFRLKVSCIGLGMYIDGFRATRVPAEKNTSGWWVQQPAHRIGRVYKPSPEFNKKHPFWLQIEEKCIEVVSQEDDKSTDELSDENINAGINKAFDRYSGA